MIIGLVGRARSGKDTVAEMLGFERFAFADALKDAFAAYHNIPRCWCDGLHEDGTPLDREDFWAYHSRRDVNGLMEGVSIRQGLQRFGTEMGRNVFGENFWVNRLDERIWTTCGPYKVVITDVRFQNEIDYVKNSDGMIVYVRRPGVDDVAAHASEDLASEYESFARVADYVIQNTGTLDDLRNQVEALKEAVL